MWYQCDCDVQKEQNIHMHMWRWFTIRTVTNKDKTLSAINAATQLPLTTSKTCSLAVWKCEGIWVKALQVRRMISSKQHFTNGATTLLFYPNSSHPTIITIILSLKLHPWITDTTFVHWNCSLLKIDQHKNLLIRIYTYPVFVGFCMFQKHSL